jgi:hypothetical protein
MVYKTVLDPLLNLNLYILFLDLQSIHLLKPKSMKYILLLLCSTFYGQTLHHQMLSSQGNSNTLPNGITVHQTIGQHSVSGNSRGDVDVQQGFQQSYWSKLIDQNNLNESVQVAVFPNPFVTTLNFQFSQTIPPSINVLIFDIQGRIVLNVQKNTIEGLATVDLSTLPDALYLVQLTAPNFNYHTKIIKHP